MRDEQEDPGSVSAEAAAVLGRVLVEVESGWIEADKRQLGYLRGAVDALAGVSKSSIRDTSQ